MFKNLLIVATSVSFMTACNGDTNSKTSPQCFNNNIRSALGKHVIHFTEVSSESSQAKEVVRNFTVSEGIWRESQVYIHQSEDDLNTTHSYHQFNPHSGEYEFVGLTEWETKYKHSSDGTTLPLFDLEYTLTADNIEGHLMAYNLDLGETLNVDIKFSSRTELKNIEPSVDIAEYSHLESDTKPVSRLTGKHSFTAIEEIETPKGLLRACRFESKQTISYEGDYADFVSTSTIWTSIDHGLPIKIIEKSIDNGEPTTTTVFHSYTIEGVEQLL